MAKVAIITGSSGGIGEALVDSYCTDGYQVIGLDKVNSTRTRSACIAIDLDLLRFCKDPDYQVLKTQEIVSYLPSVISEFVLINNAAQQIVKSVADINWTDWEASLAINSVAPFLLAKIFTEQLCATNGHIINISSIHANQTKPGFTCYAASKATLESITRSLALELSPLGVSVNAVAPAAVSTAMLRAGFAKAPKKLRQLESYHPSKSIGTPDQLATFIRSISDQRGGFLTGSVMEFNGGISGRLHDPD